MATRANPLESERKKAILEYLRAIPGCYARVVQVGGIRGRTSASKGLLDIVCIYKGQTYWIECKRGDKYGLTPEQLEFMNSWNACGGKAFVAKTTDDVRLKIQGPQMELRIRKA